MNYSVILAAGKGKRFGKEKQFNIIKNKPVIFYSIKTFNKCPVIDEIIVVTNKEKIQYVKTFVKRYRFRKVTNVIIGGKERQDSMRNALKILPNKGYVAIHDSARPLLTQETIINGFDCVKRYQASIPVIPIQDTIKQVKNGVVVKTLDRSKLCYVQTPQFFELGLLKKAYQKADKENYYATDDASLVERLGTKVHTFQGLKQNIKITDKKDVELIKALL